MLNRIARAHGNFSPHGGKAINLSPKDDGIAQLALGDGAQPLVTFLQDEGAAAVLKGMAVALENRGGGILGLHGQVLFARSKDGAGRQPHEVDGVRKDAGFVKIVDAPYETSVGVAPGAEVFHVQVANRENGWRTLQFRADLRPHFQPAIESCAEEGKNAGGHLLVLDLQIAGNDVDVPAEPVLELLSGFNYVHRLLASYG